MLSRLRNPLSSAFCRQYHRISCSSGFRESTISPLIIASPETPGCRQTGTGLKKPSGLSRSEEESSIFGIGKLSLRDQGSVKCEQRLMGTPTTVEYRLPTLSHHILDKLTILDPIWNPKVYDCPTLSTVTTEKVTPPLKSQIPIMDPDPLQRVIDQGGTGNEKYAMPYLMRIRHRKMKKHQLRKLRKRMLIVNRKLADIKRKKKEKILLEYKQNWKNLADNFDPEKHIEEQLRLARKAGFGGAELPVPAKRFGPPINMD